ncbi:MAG: 4-(cytidine 5'-diphospho)-2-C-methyl-D-erythritol kinase [Thermoanaerobaculia bacterium]
MSWTFRSFAKINLHLQVVGRRADGYHELRTVFQTVDLHDLITLEVAATGVELVVTEGGSPSGSENLAVRAARLFLGRWAPASGVRITLTKRIPVGGGLGGGSSNAATVLRGLAALFDVQPDPTELWTTARSLGADVPYFLVGGTALGVGRGDEVVPLPDLPEQELWLVVPPIEIPTAVIYAALEEPGAASLDPALGPLLAGTGSRRIADLPARNDLEPLARERFPLLREVYNGLQSVGASCARLSGSGATVFACFAASPAGDRLTECLPVGTRVIRAFTLNRTSLRERFRSRDAVGG